MSTQDPLGAGRMCPHCNRPLPDEATFCNECGRRVEGWQGNVKANSADGELPDEQVETREMQVTPEMLRAAGKKGAPPKGKAAAAPSPSPSPTGETDSAMVRGFSQPWFGRAMFVGMAVAVAVLVFFVVRKKNAAEVAAPTEPVPPVAAPPTAPPAPPTKGGKKRAPKKLAAEAVGKGVVDTPPTTVDGTKAGALPKKSTPTDSKAAPVATSDKPGATGTSPAPKPSLPSEDLPTEAAPLTDDELRQQEEGRLNADQVRYVVKQHLSQVRACYERAFKQDAPGGRVEISFAIGEDGKARRVRTDLNSTGSEPLGKCIEGLVAGWTFPRPVGGEFELTYPFVFSSGR